MPSVHLIHGQDRPSQSGESFDTWNPANGKVLDTLASGAAADIDAAVSSAREAFEVWNNMGLYERCRVLWRAGELLLERAPELATLESKDTGKPYKNSLLVDVPRSAETFQYFAGWPTRLFGQTIPVRGGFLNYTVREPLGVVGCITPWNFPLLLAARKVAAALAAGNTVVLKPPEEASLSSLALGQILLEAGLPEGACNVVTGQGESAGAALVAHPGVAKISFTGGTVTGRIIMRAAADTLKKVSLELGGKSPNLIFADADLSAAIPAAARACFYNQGEICTAGSRLLVQRSVLNQVLDGVSAVASKMRASDPFEESSTVGPLISAEHRDRVVQYIRTAEQEGGRRLVGGPVDRPGYYVDPTVIADVTPDSTLAREEVFGPVLAVIPFDTEAEAVAIANSSEFGLAAGVWTRDIGRAHGLARRLQSGTVWINTYNMFDAGSPYGGVKQSGFGRENGEEVMQEMTQSKSVWVAVP